MRHVTPTIQLKRWSWLGKTSSSIGPTVSNFLPFICYSLPALKPGLIQSQFGYPRMGNLFPQAPTCAHHRVSFFSRLWGNTAVQGSEFYSSGLIMWWNDVFSSFTLSQSAEEDKQLLLSFSIYAVTAWMFIENRSEWQHCNLRSFSFWYWHSSKTYEPSISICWLFRHPWNVLLAEPFILPGSVLELKPIFRVRA